MGTRDKRVDAYIAQSADFAKPILTYLRATMHEACPEVVESWKWSSPHFDYKGIFAGMSAFKEHAAFGFWKGALIVGTSAKSKEAMGQFGRITSLKDLPPKKVIVGYIKEAMRLNDLGVKPVRKKAGTRAPIKMPPAFAAALKKNKKAQGHFEAFPPSKQRDYLEWITEAKTDDTRDRRIATSVEWLAEGKARHWKYEKC